MSRRSRWVFIAMLSISSALAMVRRCARAWTTVWATTTSRGVRPDPFSCDWTNSNRAGVFFAMFTPLFVAVAIQYTKKKWVRLGALVIFCVELGVFATFVTIRARRAFLAVTMLFILLR